MAVHGPPAGHDAQLHSGWPTRFSSPQWKKQEIICKDWVSQFSWNPKTAGITAPVHHQLALEQRESYPSGEVFPLQSLTVSFTTKQLPDRGRDHFSIHQANFMLNLFGGERLFYPMSVKTETRLYHTICFIYINHLYYMPSPFTCLSLFTYFQNLRQSLATNSTKWTANRKQRLGIRAFFWNPSVVPCLVTQVFPLVSMCRHIHEL